MIAFNDLIAATPPPDTPPAEGGVKKHGLRIAKSDDERMLAFGWASVAIVWMASRLRTGRKI